MGRDGGCHLYRAHQAGVKAHNVEAVDIVAGADAGQGRVNLWQFQHVAAVALIRADGVPAAAMIADDDSVAPRRVIFDSPTDERFQHSGIPHVGLADVLKGWLVKRRFCADVVKRHHIGVGLRILGFQRQDFVHDCLHRNRAIVEQSGQSFGALARIKRDARGVLHVEAARRRPVAVAGVVAFGPVVLDDDVDVLVAACVGHLAQVAKALRFQVVVNRQVMNDRPFSHILGMGCGSSGQK